MYQSGREGDEAKKRKSPAKSGRVGITENMTCGGCRFLNSHLTSAVIAWIWTINKPTSTCTTGDFATIEPLCFVMMIALLKLDRVCSIPIGGRSPTGYFKFNFSLSISKLVVSSYSPQQIMYNLNENIIKTGKTPWLFSHIHQFYKFNVNVLKYMVDKSLSTSCTV